MRLFAIFILMLAFVFLGCEIEPSKSEKEAMALKKYTGPTDPAKVSGDPLNSKSKTAINLFELTKRADIVASRGDYEGAMKYLDQAIEENPKNREALRMMARSVQARAQSLKRPQNNALYLKSAYAARKLIELYPKLTKEESVYFPSVFYNEGCTFAVNGETDNAFKALNQAVDLGFRDAKLLDTDPELDPLRNRSEFEALIRRVEEASIDAALAANFSFKFQFDLPDSEGRSVKLGDFTGSLLIVEFWGSAHAAARKEIPHLIDLYKRFREKNLRVVGINDENEQSENAKAAVAAFVKDNQIPFPCLIGDESTRTQVLDFKGYPTTLFIGPDGKVRLKLNGYQTRSSLELAVTKLLDEKDKRAGK